MTFIYWWILTITQDTELKEEEKPFFIMNEWAKERNSIEEEKENEG